MLVLREEKAIKASARGGSLYVTNMKTCTFRAPNGKKFIGKGDSFKLARENAVRNAGKDWDSRAVLVGFKSC